MAAILTPTNLTVLDHSALKHPPATVEPTCPLPPLPTALAWCAEKNSVYLSSATSGILQYDLATGSLQDVSVHDQASAPVVSLLTKDRGSTLIYARGQQVTVMSSQTGRIAHTFDSHKATITSLSLSNDSTLLASTSARAIHVHNLTLASHTVLRGIPAGSGTVTTCVFHPHSRTRLLVGLGAQLLVYDTTRPSGPTKVVPIDKDKTGGAIASISCSPFSKTLVAVACSGGTVALIDLEKERGLFRSVLIPAPLTCLSFSAEGAALYAGTENGKFMLLDLRALDKPPKTIRISDNGDQVIAISVQTKLKPGEAQTAKPAPATAAAKPLVQRDTNKTAPPARHTGLSAADAVKKAAEDKAVTKKPNVPTTTTPARRTTVRTASNPVNGSPAPRPTAAGARRLNAATLKSPVAARIDAQKRAFSPPRSPVTLSDKKDEDGEPSDLSVRVENLLALPRAKEPVASVAAAVADDNGPITAVPARPPSALSRASSRTRISDVQHPRSHTRTESAPRAPTSLAAAEPQSASAALPRARSSSSSASIASRTSKAPAASTRRVVSQSSSSSRTSVSATSTTGAQQTKRRVSASSIASRLSRTPSPDLPQMEYDGGPVTPIPAYKMKGKGKERPALGALGSPEIEEWVKAGDGKDAASEKDGKRVGFAGDSESESEGEAKLGRARSDDSDSDEEADARARAPTGANFNVRRPHAELAMQVSPRRSFAGPSPSAARTGPGRWAPVSVPSPLRNPAAPPSPQARAAQDMLQALLRDALHDFRQETKAEIVGLHLDMIRMGSGWRREMREGMGEFAEEMRALREENRALREENERLRRGY